MNETSESYSIETRPLNASDVCQELDALAVMRARRNEKVADKLRMIADLQAEIAKDCFELDASIVDMEEHIKSEVVELGCSVKGESLHAVYAKGSVKWNNDKLEGYAADHPEILKFKTDGKPIASIRNVK